MRSGDFFTDWNAMIDRAKAALDRRGCICVDWNDVDEAIQAALFGENVAHPEAAQRADGGDDA